jgi:hypothetical protein
VATGHNSLAAQNAQFGRSCGSHASSPFADHIGGSARA